jgi:ferritin
MLSKKLQDALNEQMNREFFSEYQYLSMAAYFEHHDLDGFANFFHVQAQEEHLHAMKFFRFTGDRGGRVILKAIDAPKVEFKSALDVFEAALKHEQYVTQSIDALMNLAIKEGDHAVISFLKWFVDEQVEEEKQAQILVSKLRLINGEGHGMLMLNAELAAKTFNPVTAN